MCLSLLVELLGMLVEEPPPCLSESNASSLEQLKLSFLLIPSFVCSCEEWFLPDLPVCRLFKLATPVLPNSLLENMSNSPDLELPTLACSTEAAKKNFSFSNLDSSVAYFSVLNSLGG